MKLNIVYKSFLIPLTLQEITEGIIEETECEDIPIDDEDIYERAVALFRTEVRFLLLGDEPIESIYPESSRWYKLIDSLRRQLKGVFPELYPEITAIEFLSMNEIILRLSDEGKDGSY